MIEFSDDGPNWIQPSIQFPGRDEETGQNLVAVTFLMPFDCLEYLFDVLGSKEYRDMFDSQLSELIVSNFEDIVSSWEEV